MTGICIHVGGVIVINQSSLDTIESDEVLTADIRL